MKKLSLTKSIVFLHELEKDFANNQGYLLSAALAFNILLSLIPLLILSLIFFANLIDEATLLTIISTELSGIFPTAMDSFILQVQKAYTSRTVFGFLGTISLVIFSSLIFRTLKKIMKIIFPQTNTRRLHIQNIILPYFYMLMFLLISFIFLATSTTLDTISNSNWTIFSYRLDVSPFAENLTHALILLANFTLLILFYKIFPPIKIKWKHAIYAALFVGSIWMGIKQVLLLFFQHFSSISIIYGALSSFFILLISLEIFSLILLTGAQFIATYQKHKQKRQTQL